MQNYEHKGGRIIKIN